jgi:hypothetical protein
MPKSKVQPRKVAASRSIDASDAQVIYANSASGAISPWDFLFKFGRATSPDDVTVTVKEVVHLYMSPQHAKAFLDVVRAQVALYEANFGPITDIKAMSAAAAAATKKDEK